MVVTQSLCPARPRLRLLTLRDLGRNVLAPGANHQRRRPYVSQCEELAFA